MSDKQNVGNAGEFYTAYLLSSKNFVVTVTLGRNEGYDLLVVSPNNNRYRISVKTRYSKKEKKFPLSKKDDNYKGEDFYYAFIRLNDFKEEPDYWFVPSSVVSKVTRESHQSYLNEKSSRKDNPMRNFHLVRNNHVPKDWEEQLSKYYKWIPE